MLCSIKNKEELENLKELISLQSQKEETRLQDKVGKQNLYELLKVYLNQLLIKKKYFWKINEKFD